jgi:group I intron endonuclease
MFVYVLHFPNGKRYVGISKNVTRRLKWHGERQSLVGNAIRKHGRPEVQVLIECSTVDAKEIERRLISLWQTQAPRGYNITAGGDGLLSPTAATRAKMSASHKGQDHWAGRKHRPETRAKMSAARKPQSVETIGKAADGVRRSWTDPEIRAKRIAGMTGRRHSPETLARLREAAKGRRPSALALARSAEVRRRKDA